MPAKCATSTHGVIALVALQLAVLLAQAHAAYKNPQHHGNADRLRDPHNVSRVVQSHDKQ